MIGVDPVNMQKTESGIPCLALRPREAAKALGVGERTLWEWTTQGLVPHIKIGRMLMYPVESLRQWLQEQTRSCAAKEEGNGKHSE